MMVKSHRSRCLFIEAVAVVLAWSLVALLLLPHAASALLSPYAPSPPTHHTVASTIPAPPPPAENPFVPSPLDNFFVLAFRWTLQQQTGLVSSTPGFEGMTEELLRYRTTNGIDALELASDRTMTALAGPIPFLYRHLFAAEEISPAVLAWFAKHLLPFLVGDMILTNRGPDDTRGGGVLVKRCRVLEGSACKGVCAKMCKVPTQRFFEEQWGVPLTMTPNFETGECQLAFGVTPIPIEDDPTIPPGCLGSCPAFLGSNHDDLASAC